MTNEQKLTLFKALKYIGFKSTKSREISRGNVTVSLKIGHRSHWYVSTPLGSRDYQGQRQALHALVLYKLISKEDLQKLADLEYEPAVRELESLEGTAKRSINMITKANRNDILS